MARTISDLFTGPIMPHRRPGQVDLTPAVHGIRIGRGETDSQRRKAKAKATIQSFCTTYLAHHFPTEFGEHHDDLFAAIDRKDVDKRVVRVEPRKHGKTSIISLALPLYMLAYKLKRFILLIGESTSGAKINLASIVEELENNELLLKDFPHLVPARDMKNQLSKWTDEHIQLQDGSQVLAKGIGSKMRGLKTGASRPDLGIVDDPESPESCASFVTRIRHRKWFGGTFLGLGGDHWDVYVISNLPHHDCLVAHLLRSDKWDGKLYRAINIPPRENEKYPIGNRKTDGSSLWPQGWPLAKLRAYEADPTVGALGFAREMMGDPRDEKDKPFDSSQFTYIDVTPKSLLTDYPDGLVGFFDPSGGDNTSEIKKGRKDYGCFAMGGTHKDGFVDILFVHMTKKKLDEQIDEVLDHYAANRLTEIGVEENIAKNLIGPELNRRAKERKMFPTVKEMHQIRNKQIRILATQPQIANGTIRFNRALTEQWPEFFGQYDDFPGDHDDGPDAVEGLIRMCEKLVVIGTPTGISGTSYWKGRG